jgi:hypothetical protein
MAVGCQPNAPAALCSPETLFFCFWYSFLLGCYSSFTGLSHGFVVVVAAAVVVVVVILPLKLENSENEHSAH